MTPARRAPIWQPYVRAAIAFAILGGFSTGTVLFLVGVFDLERSQHRSAIVDAHEQFQLLGWATLMVLGVGIHFLPRLASTIPVNPRSASVALHLLCGGILARAFASLLQASDSPSLAGPIFDLLWIAGCGGTFGGAVIIATALLRSLRAGWSTASFTAIGPILPFFGVGICSLLLAQAAPIAGRLWTLANGVGLSASGDDDLLIQLMLYGVLVPISVAMSARLFPLYVRTGPPRIWLLRVGLALTVAGLCLRMVGAWDSELFERRTAGLLLLAGIILFVVALRIFEPRRQLPRKKIAIWREPTGLHALSAYVWLLCAAIVQPYRAVWQDSETHLIGMGFVTLLILGMGTHLLPGFARGSIRHHEMVWGTLILGNASTILRLLPAIPGHQFPASITSLSGSLAGITGLAAITLFAVNISVAIRPRRPVSPTSDQSIA